MALIDEIAEVAFHRNGIAGEGFHVVRFTGSPDGKPEAFLAILFDGAGRCAVIGLDRIEDMGVAFARGNSWRGDHFEGLLREAIKDADTGRVGPFCLPRAALIKAEIERIEKRRAPK